MNLVVDCLRRPASFDQLKSIWQTLERLDPLCSPFMSWAYMSAWWKSAGVERGKLRLLIVRDGNEVVGIAPLFVENSQVLKLVPVNTLRFMGGMAGLHSKHHGLIAHPRLRAPSCLAVINYLPTLKAWHSLCLEGVGTDSLFAALLRQRIKQGSGVLVEESLDTVRVEKLPSSWDQYLAVNKNHRAQELARIGALIKPLGASELSICSTREVFNQTQKMFNTLATEVHHEPAFADSLSVNEFYKGLAQHYFLADALWQVCLKIDGQVVGVQHYCIERCELILFQASYASQVQATGVAQFMLVYAIKRAIEQGFYSVQIQLCDDDFSRDFVSTEVHASTLQYTPSKRRRWIASVYKPLIKR